MRIQGQAIGAGDLLFTEDGAPFYVDSFSPGSGEVWGYRAPAGAERGPLLTRRAAALSWENPCPPNEPTTDASGLLASYRMDGMGPHADKWGSVMGALFPVCEELYQRRYFESHDWSLTEELDAGIVAFLTTDAKFKAGAGLIGGGRQYLDREAGLTPDGDPDPEADGGNFWAQEARAADTAELLKFGRILSRYSRWLRAAGEDY
jgi:hypothetical protein